MSLAWAEILKDRPVIMDKANPMAAGGPVGIDGYPLPDKKVDLNNGIGRQISSGLVGASWAWPEATYDEREKIWDAHKQ